jgi:hypothetical protein
MSACTCFRALHGVASGEYACPACGSQFRYCPERGCERWRSAAHQHGRNGYAGIKRKVTNPVTNDVRDDAPQAQPGALSGHGAGWPGRPRM